ncbi:hypothetical protein JR893_17835, partial [Klebsiella pneumoniae]|nr:hypothetical protein [Klebsiella pneumoniae]
VGGPVGDFELLLCHGTVCVVGKIRDLILQLSKSSIYSTKPGNVCHVVNGPFDLLANKGCATLFGNDAAVWHRYLSPISLSSLIPLSRPVNTAKAFCPWTGLED